MDNELYRGYKIVSLAENPEHIRILDDKDEYIPKAMFLSFDNAKEWLDIQIRKEQMRDLSAHLTRIGVSSENKLQLEVSTPGGDIVVKSGGGGVDYPDASIYIGGHCVAFVEWNADSKQFNLHYYGVDDEPKATFKNITEI